MKKINNQYRNTFVINLLLFLLLSLSTIAQTPNLFNYQAIIRDSEGAPKVDANVEITISILQGEINNAAVFGEVHTTTTNSFGLVNLEIGSVNTTGFESVNWVNGPFFISIMVDGTQMGTSQLLSVPFAKYADFANNIFSGDYEDLQNLPEEEDCEDVNDEIQSFIVSAIGDTLFLTKSNWVIIPGISAANFAGDCPNNLPNPDLVFEESEEYSTASGDFIRYKLDVTNFNVYPDFLFDESPDLPPCGLNDEASRAWVDIFNGDDERIYGFCALGEASGLNDIWFAVEKGLQPPSEVYIKITDRLCEKVYTSNKVAISNEYLCNYNQFMGDWVNEDTETRGITTGVISEMGDNLSVHLWGSCTPTDCDWGSVETKKSDANDCVLELTWTSSFAIREQTIEALDFDRLEVITNTHYTDGSVRVDFTSTDIFVRESECDVEFPNPVIELEGFEEYMVEEINFIRYKLNVSNFASYPDILFEASPDLPACGLNENSSRSWVDIYNGDGTRIYGFCALAVAANLKDIWFAVEVGKTPPAEVYIEINDRKCKNIYKSNTIDIPDYQQCEFIQFLGFWENEDPGTSGITKADITENGSNLNIQMWGSCVPTDCDWGIIPTPKTNAGNCILEVVWNKAFVVRTQTIELVSETRIKVVTNSHYIDDSGRPDYTSIEYLIKNTECDLDLPNPIIELEEFEEYEVGGATYIRYKLDVTNYSAFPNELFEASPDLPPCGLNESSSRAWVDIYNGDGTRLYGFCALGTAASLNDIWFSVLKGNTPPENVYIVINDRLCDMLYTSNSIKIPSYVDCYYTDFIGDWKNEDENTGGITRALISNVGTTLQIQMWGACSPTDCVWGAVSTLKSDADDCTLNITWEFSFKSVVQSVELLDNGKLKVISLHDYIEADSREDRTITEYFIK